MEIKTFCITAKNYFIDKYVYFHVPSFRVITSTPLNSSLVFKPQGTNVINSCCQYPSRLCSPSGLLVWSMIWKLKHSFERSFESFKRRRIFRQITSAHRAHQTNLFFYNLQFEANFEGWWGIWDDSFAYTSHCTKTRFRVQKLNFEYLDKINHD